MPSFIQVGNTELKGERGSMALFKPSLPCGNMCLQRNTCVDVCGGADIESKQGSLTESGMTGTVGL